MVAMRLLLLPVAISVTAWAGLTSLYMEERTDHKNGASFANVGPYEHIKARATLSDGAVAEMTMLKPRDPKKGNGTLLYMVSEGPSETALLEAGFTVVRLEGNPPAAIRDVIGFLRYGGPNLFLGDQSGVLKRFAAFAAGGDAKVFDFMVKQGFAKDEKSRKIFDVFWLHEAELPFEPIPETKAHVTRGKTLDALAIQLHRQLAGGQ